MSGFNEEEITSPTPESPDSPRHIQDLPMEETDHSEEEHNNALVPVSNITSTTVVTNVLAVTTPIVTLPNPFGEGSSRPPRSLLRRLRTPRYPVVNPPQSRRLRLIHTEPPAQRMRRSNNLNEMPRFLAEWRIEEGLLNSNQFRIAVGPTNIPALTMEPLHDTVPTLVLRTLRAERCIAELRERTNILRTHVEDHGSTIDSLESEMAGAHFRIHDLEDTVLELQEKITRFEAMFEAISRAATITPPTQSQ